MQPCSGSKTPAFFPDVHPFPADVKSCAFVLSRFSHRHSRFSGRVGAAGRFGLNAVSRPIVQNLELRKLPAGTAEPVKMPRSPKVLLLLLFIFGVGVVVWMGRKGIAAETKPAAAGWAN